MVITDDYSRYPIVEIIKSTAAKIVILVIDKVFAECGVPHTLNSDNWSPFQSGDFAKFAKFLGFKHRRITPYWPRAPQNANGLLKPWANAPKLTLQKVAHTSRVSACILAELSCDATSNYWCPAIELIGRAIRTRLPELSVALPDESMAQETIS